MIKNERQYKITKTKVEKFGTSILDLENKIKISDDPLLKLEYDALVGQRLDLQRELQEYEELKSGNIPIMELTSMEDLPRTLIGSRIALGLSQKDLALKVGLQEQQIQRYEHTDYESASLNRINEIFAALQLEKENGEFLKSKPDLKNIFKKLSSIGLDRSFITNRLIPQSILSFEKDSSKELCDLQAAVYIGKIFGWNSEQMLGSEPLKLKPIDVKFKMPKNANRSKAHAYSVYSRYVAMLLSQITSSLEKKSIPDNPYVLREKIFLHSFDMSFKSLMRFVWDLGIPVISLDPHSFHAACFRDDSKSIIVLTQKTASEARWMFNLLHELYHVITGIEKIDFEDYSDSEDELDANQFAHVVLLGTNPDKLLHICLDKCLVDDTWNFSYLKKVVRQVAENKNVRIDVLANYVAHRLSSENIYDWWGVAENLQEPMNDAQIVVRDSILEHSDFTLLSKPDLDLLKQALKIGDVY